MKINHKNSDLFSFVLGSFLILGRPILILLVNFFPLLFLPKDTMKIHFLDKAIYKLNVINNVSSNYAVILVAPLVTDRGMSFANDFFTMSDFFFIIQGSDFFTVFTINQDDFFCRGAVDNSGSININDLGGGNLIGKDNSATN